MTVKKPPFTRIDIEDDPGIKVLWNVKLGRLAEGYARGGDYHRGTIRMAPGQTLNGQRVAVVHEIGHHLWDKAGLDQFLSVKTEELVIDALAQWLVSTLRRNPALVAWLLEEA